MGLILSIIAYSLFPIVALANFFIYTWKNINTFGFFKSMNRFWFLNALELDIYSNYHFKTFFNVTMRKKGGYHFGKFGETISSALGKNQKRQELSFFGWLFVLILWVIDVKYLLKGGHCINSIMYSYEIEEQKNKIIE